MFRRGNAKGKKVLTFFDLLADRANGSFSTADATTPQLDRCVLFAWQEDARDALCNPLVRLVRSGRLKCRDRG